MSEIRYSYESLVDSNIFKDCNWAARAALQKNKSYTKEEAKRIVSYFLSKPVKEVK